MNRLNLVLLYLNLAGLIFLAWGLYSAARAARITAEISLANAKERLDDLMDRKKVSTTIYLDPNHVARLRALTEKTKVPMAIYIRQGIAMALAKAEEANDMTPPEPTEPEE